MVPAAVATTHVKPHAQQQLARDIEVGRAAIGQRRRPHGFACVARQSAAMSMAGLVNCSFVAVQLQQKQSQSLRLDPYVSHRGGSIVVLPAANLRGPPDKYGLHTLGRPSVRCCPTLRTWLLCAAARFVSDKQQSH